MIDGKAFPHRDLIIFLTFCVIFSTLVLQGLTLRPLINWLGVKSDGSEHRNEMDARLKLLSGIIEHIEENYSLALSDDVLKPGENEIRDPDPEDPPRCQQGVRWKTG